MFEEIRKKIKIKNFILLLIGILFSCNNSPKVYKIYDENRHLIQQYELLNGDTIQRTEYFKNGKIKYTYNGLLELAKTYYPNGMLEQIQKYKNDTSNGVWILYDSTGFLEEKVMILNNKSLLARKWIRKKDSLVEKYLKMISDSTGVTIGTIYYYKGKIDTVKSCCLKIFTKDTINFMDTIKLTFRHYDASPVDSVIVLEFGALNSDLDLIESPNNVYTGIFNSKEITYSFSTNKKGGFVYVSGVFLVSTDLPNDKGFIGRYPFIKEIYIISPVQ